MWQVEALTEEKAVENLRGEWLELADQCETATVFQSFEWLMTWWRHLGRRFDRRLFVVSVRDASGKLVGIAPLMTSSWHGTPLRRLSFVGTGATDYNDVIADTEHASTIITAIYDFLAAGSNWHICDFAHLRDGGLLRSHPPVETHLSSADFDHEACPFLPFPNEGVDTWRALLQRYPKKTRDHIGYYERRLSGIYEVDNHYVTQPSELDGAMSALFELHMRRWNKRWLPGVLNGKRVQAFHRSIASQFLEREWLRLHILVLDGDIQAALYCFRSKERTLYYQGGFEPTLARLSLGTVLTTTAIRDAIGDGATEFDFLRGDEPYKERWTRGESRMNVRRIMARKGTPYMSLAVKAHHIEHGIETRFKNYMHHAYLQPSKPQVDVREQS